MKKTAFHQEVQGGLVQTSGLFPTGEEPPLTQISWIFIRVKGSACESGFTLGAGSVALRKRYFSKEGFPECRSQAALLTPPFSLYCSCDSPYRERAARLSFLQW